MPKKNSFAGLLASFRNRLGQSNSPRARSLHFEALEERQLLTVASVCAYDALAAEGSIADDGVFRVDIDEPCVDPITINYQLGGTTDTGGNTSSDYMVYSSSGTRLYPSRTYDASTGQYVYQGSITLAAGEQSATLLIRPVNDTLRESSETVALSLLAGTGYTVDSNADTASIVIADNDQWTVSLETTDANASETSTDYGSFTLTRSGETDLSNPLRVYLTAGGTAGIGAYYYDIADCRLFTASGVQATWTSWTENGVSSQGYYVDIPANQTSLVLQVRPTDDMYREDPETVTLTLAPRSDYYTVDSVHNSGTVTIADNDQWTVSVTASDSQATEGGTDYGLFTITRSGETDLNRSLTVKFSMTGTASYNSDYQLKNSSGGNISLSSSWDSTLGVYVYTGTVTIAYGAGSTTVELRTVNNGTTESAETAQLNLLDNGYYAIDPEHAAAVVTILDNDDWTVSVTAIDSHAEEGGTDYGRWVISRSGSTDTAYAMTVKFRMLGSAQYNSSSYSSDYTLHTSTGSTINLTSAYDDTLEQYVYSGLIQIAGGQTETIVELRPANDATRETTETAVLELVEYGTPSYTIGTAQSEIQIIDNDQWTVNVQAETALSAESTSPQPMTMRISRSGETDLTKPLTVYFRLGGTALYSTDYTLSGGSYFTSNNYGSVTIAAGQSSAVLSITPVNDALRESSETVILSLIDSPIGAPTYSLGADTVASGTIADNDQWVVNVTAIDGAETNAAASPVQFIFTRTGETDLSQALTVYYRLGGTAAYGTDYTVSGYNTTYDYSTIIIGSGAATATLNLSVVNDAYLEDSETIEIEILSALPENYQPYSGYGPQTIPPINYLPGEDSAAAAVIEDNDQWTVTAEATAAAGYEVLPGETAQPIQFTISRSGSSDLSKSLTVYYELSGSATLGSDYTISGAVVSGRYGYVTIAAGAASAVMTASVINDAETEGTETVVLTLLNERPSVFANGGYTLYSEAEYYLGTAVATGYIADQANSQTVAVTSLGTAKETSGGQTAAPARWLFTRSGGSNASALYVFYTLGGTATAGSDYTAPTQSIAGLRYIQIPAGQETAELSLSISDDSTAESAESVVVSVVPLNASLLSWGYTPYIIAPDAAAAETIIQDNDTSATIVVDGPASVAQDETVTLTASIGLDPYGAQNWVFSWDTDADGVYETSGNSIAVNGGLYSAGGTITFSVQAVSGDYTAVQSKTLSVVNTPPLIELSGPIVGEANSPITWSGSFTDPGSDTWTASVLVVETGQSQNVTLGSDQTFCFSQTFSEVGRYTLELSISDGSEISTVRKEILIGSYPAGGIGANSLIAVQEGTYSVLLSGSTITLPPVEPGTLTAQAFWLVNRGNESITLEWGDLSLPEGLFLLTGDAFVPGEDIVLGAGERFYAQLGWNAWAPLSGTVTVPMGEESFLLHFLGTPAAITDSPALSSFGLLYDSGDSSSDRITCNPIIAGTVSGNFAGGTVRVEFDHDGDGVAEGSKVLYFDGMSFRYDPRQSDADWPEVLSGTESVELSYRLIHLKNDGTPYSTGSWNTFQYTLVPIPAAAAAVGNLCVGAGNPGAWTLAGSAVLTGSVTGTAEQVEVRVGGQTFFAEVKSQQFSLALPALAFGETVTIRARALSDNTALQMAVPGSWTATTITPALPAVTSLALVTDDGVSSSDGISSVLTLTGTLAAGVGRTFTEVEFSCGNTILGSSWTDENGSFVWTPTGLPIVGGTATGTITAKAVWRPEEGLPVYGTSASVAVTYAPAESSEPLTLSLADATNTAGTQTGTPLITVLGTFDSEAMIRYEYQWKVSGGDWSTAEQSAAAAADEVNEDNEADFEASLRLSGFGALSGSSSAITVRARALVYDTILGTTRPLTDWSTLAFTYVKPAVALQLDDLELADPIGEGSASRPTLTGTVTGAENLSGLVISVFNGAALVGTTKTDSDGYFSVLPTLTQYGPVTLTVKVTFWDSDAREYATETLDTISFNYIAPTTSAAVIDELRLLNDTNANCTGLDYDGVTAQTILTGRLRNDGEPLERVTVEIDLDGDGTAETSVLTDSQGRFTYTAHVASGQYTAGARAVRWDFSQQCAVLGQWKTLTFTYSPDQNSTVPFLAEFGPITGLLNADGTMVTTDPAVAGRVVALCGSADVTIQLDLDADGIVEETLTPDTLGNFCWRPSVTPSGTDTQVTIAVRLGRTDNDITTWGSWSQFQYIYRAPAESILLDWDIRNTAEENVFIISGSILAASGIDSAALQIDCTGDEEIDGIVYANSVGEFLYTGAVDRSEIRVRIVDTLTTGTQRLASSGWTTLTVRDFTQQDNATSPQLSLQQNTSEPDTAGFDLRVTGMIGSYSSLTVAFDIDTDGTTDFTLHPSASGLISASEIADALAARVSYGGLFFAEARISAPAAQVSDPIYVPVLIADGLNAEELSSAQTLLTAYSAAYSGSQSAQTGITQTGSDDPAAGLSIQTTSEPASDASSPSVTDDWKVLAASAFPSIEIPTIIGEIPNLSTDITLADDLSRIARQYDMNLSEAAKTYSLAYAAMEDQYNAACQYAWNIYNARYQELLARYQSLLEESWSDTGEDTRLRSEYNQAIDDASARRAAQQTAVNQTYTAASSALNSAYLDDYMSEHGDCSGSCTIECLDHQLAALRTYNAGLIGAEADRDEALVQIEADYLNAFYNASYTYQTQRAAAEYSWTINHLNAIEAIISEMISIEQTYEQACLSAFSFFSGAGALAQTYLNACAAAYQTAVTQSWAQIQSALAQWSIDPATDSGWAACLQAIVGNLRQADTSAAAAYVSAVSAQAAALNTAITAQMNAERLYSQTTAAASYAAEQAKLAAELTCQRTAALEKRAYLFSTNERVKEEACLQISSALNAQISMMDRYEEYQLASLDNSYQLLRRTYRLARQFEQGTITQEEYLASYQSANSAAEDRQSRLMRWYNADKITITERMVLAKHNSAERIELGFIQDYNDYQKRLCDAYGLCLKAENNADAAQTNANSAAAGSRNQTLNSAQAALESAQNNAYYTYLSTALGAESTALYANNTLLTSRASALIGEYLTNAAALCENMGTAAGDFYAEVCVCLENYYNAEETALNALNTALRAKSSALTSSYIALESAYTGSVSSAIWNCANTINAASLAASLVDPTYQNERIDTQVAYSKALEQARADEQTTIVRAAFEYHRARTSFDADTARWINDIGAAAITGPNGCLSVNTYYLSDFTSTYYLYYDGTDRSYYYLDDSMFPPAALYGYLQGYENGNSMALNDYMNTSSFAGVSLTINSPVALGAVSQDQWNQITGAAYTLRSLKQGAAAAKRQADEAAAWYDYVADYTASGRAQAADELTAYQTSVQTELSAGQTLQTAYWNAVVTASTALNSALYAADSTGIQLDYLANTVTNLNTLELGLTGAFGRFQTAWRQERLNSLDVDSPYYATFASDLSQISQISAARNNACAQDILAREGFYDTLFEKWGNYSETDLEESAAYLSNVITASRTFSQTQYSLAAAYEQSVLAAAIVNALDTIDAEIAEVTANALAEKNARAAQYQGHADYVSAHTQELTLTYNGGIESLFSYQASPSTIQAQYTALGTTLSSAAQNSIDGAQTQNALIKQSSLSLAEARYQRSCHSALGLYLTGQLAVEVDYAVSVNAAETFYQTAMDNAQEEFDQAVIPVYYVYHDQSDRLDQLYNQAVSIINGGGSVPADYFTDPDTELEVCLPAGEKVILDDGTVKSIETIKIGDRVKSIYHNDVISGKIETGKVIRVFRNAPQPIWTATFLNGRNNETFEIRTTGGHRFFASEDAGLDGKWCRMDELVIGNHCLNAKGESVELIKKTFSSANVPVFNFEVEGLHTYFAGESTDRSALTHNAGCGAIGVLNKVSRLGNDFLFGSEEMNQRNKEKLSGIITPLASVEIGNETVRTHIPDGSYELAKEFADTLFSSAYSLKGLNSRDLYRFVEKKVVGGVIDKVGKEIVYTFHYDLREKLNNNDQFKDLSERQLIEIQTLSTGDIREYLGVIWKVCPPGESVCHSKKDETPKKLISEKGREFVVNTEGYVETDPRYVGTYNYCSTYSGGIIRYVGHFVLDVYPWLKYGNNRRDTTSVLDRLIMLTSEPANKENNE